MTISEQNLWLSPGPLIIPLQSLLIPWEWPARLPWRDHRPPACLLETASVPFSDGWRQEGSSWGCDVAAGVNMVTHAVENGKALPYWFMNPVLNRFFFFVCVCVYSAGCVPLLCKALTISEVIWKKGLNDTVNIYCTWQQTVLCKWRSSRCVQELVSI